MALPEYTVAVDPGWNKGAFAIFEGEKFIGSATFNVEKAKDKLSALITQAAQVLIPKEGRRVLAIETQYAGQNIATMEKVVMSRMAWEVVAVQMGFEIERMKPSQWQSKVANIHSRMGREEIGLAYCRVAKLLSGIDFKMDEAAAYCIGQYFIGLDKYKQKYLG